MSEKTPVIPNQWAQAAASDEIDLRELVLVLWRQKVLILLVTGAFAVAGIVYAMTARQVWTSQAVISEPSVSQVGALQLAVIMSSNSSPLTAAEFSSFEQPAIFQSFTSAFNSMNNKRDF